MIEIKYKTNKIEKNYTNKKYLIKEFGNQIAEKYLHFIQLCNVFETLALLDETFKGRYQPEKLSGKNKGKWSVHLGYTYRLNFTLDDKSGGTKVQILTIEKIHPHKYEK